MLSGPQRPIVLMPRRTDGPVADAVAPHNPDLGVMLAYTPLHALLFGLPGDEPGPAALVMTSGNLGGEPICFTDDDALDRLSHLADGWLMHNRAILVPCDDSVVRVVDGVELPIRRSRGYAPLPIALPVPVPPTLAVGADLKNTMAVADGKYAWLSQHIGDMDDLATLSAFDSAQSHLQALTGVAPDVLVADAHPLYRSTAWAHRNAAGRPVRTVQHHHAHIAAVMAEHGLDGSQRGARVRLRRNRLRARRSGMGRRGAARKLQGLPAARSPEIRAARRGRHQRSAALSDGACAPVGGRPAVGP